MSKGAKANPESGPLSSGPEHGPPRNPYQPPVLVEWGALVELTRGNFSDVQDDDFSGSGGV